MLSKNSDEYNSGKSGPTASQNCIDNSFSHDRSVADLRYMKKRATVETNEAEHQKKAAQGHKLINNRIQASGKILVSYG